MNKKYIFYIVELLKLWKLFVIAANIIYPN